jgi:hypothetical protein
MRRGAARFRAAGFGRALAPALLAAVAVFCGAEWCLAQGSGFERSFPQSKATVEKVLQEMQTPTAGRLPVLDGFATSADHPLDRFQRGYYQSQFQVSAAPSGGSTVRVNVEVTAWYADPVAARSGYQLLTSNGRLEADLLDQLADQLAGKAPQVDASSPATAPRKPFPSEKSALGPALSGQSSSQQSSPLESSSAQAVSTPPAAEPTISAPVPQLPESRGALSSPLAQGLSEQEKAALQTGPK